MKIKVLCYLIISAVAITFAGCGSGGGGGDRNTTSVTLATTLTSGTLTSNKLLGINAVVNYPTTKVTVNNVALTGVGLNGSFVLSTPVNVDTVNGRVTLSVITSNFQLGQFVTLTFNILPGQSVSSGDINLDTNTNNTNVTDTGVRLTNVSVVIQ
jgi:hypothetical protein